MFDELIKMIEDVKIDDPVFDEERWFNIAVKHVEVIVKQWIKDNYPLGKNDYQE